MFIKRMPEHICPKCNLDCGSPSALAKHLKRKYPCDQGKYECDLCHHKFQTWESRYKHKQTCTGREPTRQELLDVNTEIQSEMAISVQQQQQMSDDNSVLLQEVTVASKDVTVLLQENRRLQEQVVTLQQQLQAISTDMNSVRARFSFNVEDINFKGIYLIEISGIVLDTKPEDGSIVVKLGRATEQTIGKRAHDTLKKHPNNRILYLRRCSDAGTAENKLKSMLRMFKMLESGSAPDGKHGIEFAAFQPGQADEVKQMFDLAVFQADAPATVASDSELEKLKLQLEILKEQRALSEQS